MVNSFQEIRVGQKYKTRLTKIVHVCSIFHAYFTRIEILSSFQHVKTATASPIYGTNFAVQQLAVCGRQDCPG